MLSKTRTAGARPYRMGRRAEHVEQTRQRITEAAVRLHTTVGPAHTSIVAVAAEAGVTRLTVYRHFADLDALFGACMAHWSARNPRPDTAAWRAIPGIEERARRAFGELYGWYREHGDELYPLYRDAAAMPLSALRSREAANQATADALVAGHADLDSHGDGRLLRVVARHLIDFRTWHSLVIAQGLSDPEAVRITVRLLTAVAEAGHGVDDGGPEPT